LKVAEDKRRDNSKRDINRFVTVAGNQPAELTQLQLEPNFSRTVGLCGLSFSARWPPSGPS